MDIHIVNRIKRLAIIALASDDELVEALVLKGGNAIDLSYQQQGIGHGARTSFDLDYSIDHGDFDKDLPIADRIERTLAQTFNEDGYTMIDYSFGPKPKIAREEVADFWGGYKVEFKVISNSLYEENKEDPKKLSRMSIPVNMDNSPKFELEFSKFEFVEKKVEAHVDGFKIYVYTPEMIVFEKVRALCQQLPRYKEVVPSFSPRARAKDFYDIHLMVEQYKIDPGTTENLELIQNIFSAKKVPVGFIKDLQSGSAFHADNWKDVVVTLPASEALETFEYYRDYVVNKFASLTFP
ncbi:nucleotidyl transferase AbiEii/AbiGii toxin family protein [Chryseolinea soli]|uniref:Nucleotidyl transferase AbiEii/AbiGii toxin family protein n=1 Tax=Chryseolinea soli TaxID=2321403 RepID=A0A385SNV2_9BACT|nr:nucleotidyl transferase AbiEii/AbiGii toxin family protein [Chryseolinea soli]AYB31937.1 hypothetical protein D4L85_15795 [Chryseolinea soli]